MRKKPKNIEHEHQKAFFKWFRYAYPHVVAFAIPNAAKRGYKLAAMMKAEGLVSGVPDILIADGKPGCFIEMKVKGNKPTKRQQEMLKRLKSAGYHAVVCYGWEEAKTAAEFYLNSSIAKCNLSEV